MAVYKCIGCTATKESEEVCTCPMCGYKMFKLPYDCTDVLISESERFDPVSQYFGATAEKTQSVIQRAIGGVLFVDEAYALANNSDINGVTDYGKEVIDTLVKAMEDYRGRLCVIFAGYKDEMKKMLGSNPGLESRIHFTLDFPDYTRAELCDIASAFLKKKKYEINDEALEAVSGLTEYYRSKPNFANARTVRNILDSVIMNQNLRTEDSDGDNSIIIDDVEEYITEQGIDLSQNRDKQRHIGFIS